MLQFLATHPVLYFLLIIAIYGEKTIQGSGQIYRGNFRMKK